MVVHISLVVAAPTDEFVVSISISPDKPIEVTTEPMAEVRQIAAEKLKEPREYRPLTGWELD